MGITAVDTITGTPLYLSPEAIRSPDQLDARGDIYALGAVGYYLLTGEHVFMGATAIEVFSHHLTTEPDRPSDRVGREISKDLEALILRCLEKDRDKRPSDAESFLTALERCADSGTWTHKEAREWWSEQLESTAGHRQRSGLTTDSGDLSETFAVALEDR